LYVHRRPIEMETAEQAATGHPPYAEGERSPREMFADRQRIGNEPFALDDVECGKRRSTGNRATAKGASEVAGSERVREAGRGDDRPDREPACQSLGQRERIRRHAVCLRRTERSAPSDAALNLVEQQGRPTVVTDPAGRP